MLNKNTPSSRTGHKAEKTKPVSNLYPIAGKKQTLCHKGACHD